MAYSILSNKKNTTAVILITSNSTITIAGNSTVSNVATGSEVLTGCYITQIFCGSNSGAASKVSNAISKVDFDSGS